MPASRYGDRPGDVPDGTAPPSGGGPRADATADLSGIGDAVSSAGPVAALDGEGWARGAAPVALFDADEVGATRVVVPGADMGASALGSGRAGRSGGRAEGDAGRARSDDDAPLAGRRRAGSTGPATDRAASTVSVSGDRAGTGTAAATGTAADSGGAAAGRRRELGQKGGSRSGSCWGAASELDPDADPVAVAREICLRLLTDRARTRHELANVLRRRGVPDEAVATVLERFDEVGLIDDTAFAGQWVRNRHTGSRGLGRRALAVELRRKGVADDVAADALAEVDADAEAKRARELVDRKLRSMKLASPDDHGAAARRLAGMLARKGYSGAVTWSTVRAALAAHGADLDGGAEPPDD